MARGNAPDLYLIHTVKKGENWYSVGRAYGLSPKDIAARNKMQMDQGLSLGKQLTIPLSKNNFVQTKDAGSGARPVYHKVAEKETLYRISVKYDKVPLDNVRQWNHFSGDAVKKNSYLIVGWVKNQGLPASTAAKPPASSVAAPAVARPASPPPVIRQETPVQQKEQPVAQQETPVQQKEQPVAQQETPVQKEQPAAQQKPAEEETAYQPVHQQENKPSESLPTSAGRTPSLPENGFEQAYMQQTNNGEDVVSEKGPGSWFRSNAVTGSGKYYALHNSAPRGTIVKVTNPLNGHSIYAKVLDAIPQLKQNANLIIKLSDAAQSALGITEGKFYCELKYEEK